MKASVYTHTTLIGHTDLKPGDVSMGGLYGEFLPNEHYFTKVQPAVWRFWAAGKPDYKEWSELRLNVQLENGCFLFPLGGYTIDDAPEFPDESLRIDAAGVYRFIIEDFFEVEPALPFLQSPWESLTIEQKIAFEDELVRELANNKDHVLAGYTYEAVAKDCRSDDVLFVLWRRGNAENQFARVHLTWRVSGETDPRWPSVRFFEDFEAFKTLQMLPDAADYED